MRVDRVELSKNILRGFGAFEELLETRPGVARPGGHAGARLPVTGGPGRLPRLPDPRSSTPRSGSTTRWGTADWTPIVLDVADDRDRSVAALTRYDVLLVNPVRDGLNLVAKEGPLVNRSTASSCSPARPAPGRSCQPAAVGVNPFDVTGTALALELALGMDPDERANRAAALRDLVLGRTAADWLDDQRAAGERLA